ncbi:hypothetical protein AVW11_08920 [Streptomyces amritsarensis]|uniref:Uncharacterized protein n=1 Tax=Streptomyces amritsarensis TaxID=681158 RepID=A0ABX3G5S5_9ACTN|nr:hypothetical protein AVW11_08920 [Streptomyces amritsarensis]
MIFRIAQGDEMTAPTVLRATAVSRAPGAKAAGGFFDRLLSTRNQDRACPCTTRQSPRPRPACGRAAVRTGKGASGPAGRGSHAAGSSCAGRRPARTASTRAW